MTVVNEIITLCHKEILHYKIISQTDQNQQKNTKIANKYRVKLKKRMRGDKILARKICFTSFKGGVGKTTLCVQTAYRLAEIGERVLIIDGDSVSCCACIACEVAGAHTFTLHDLEAGVCRAKQTIVQHPRHCTLFVCSSQNCIDEKTFSRAIDELEPLFDYVLCDDCALSSCKEFLVITEPYTPSLKSADACISALRSNKKENVKIVVNKVNGGQIFNGEIITPEEISFILHAPLAAVIPEDLNVAVKEPNRKTNKALCVFTENLKKGTNKVFNCTKSYCGLWGEIKKKVRNTI